MAPDVGGSNPLTHPRFPPNRALTLLLILAYLAGVTAAGALLVRRAETPADWAVAGGGLGFAAIAFGVAGTRIGGIATYGVAERTMNGGVWYAWWYGITTLLALAILGVFFAVPYRRLQLRTIGELFLQRWNSHRCQSLTSLCVQSEYPIVTIIEAYLIGAILVSLTGIPMFAGVMAAAAVLVTCAALGGLRGAAATNIVHCGVILCSLVAIGVTGTTELGGWHAAVAAADARLVDAGRDTTRFRAFAGAGPIAAFGMFVSASIHTPAASVYTNFSTAARRETMLVPAFLLGGALAAAMPLLAGWIGVLTLAKYDAAAGLRGYASLTQLAADAHPLLGAVALAAILAAVISSGVPILLAGATMVVNDWLPRLRTHHREPSVRTYRMTTLIYGVVAAVLAYVVALTQVSLLDLLLFGFSMVVPPAVAATYVLYWRRTTETACYAGMVSGYAGGLLWFLLIKLALAANPSYPALFLPLVIIPLVSLATGNPDDGSAFRARLHRPRR